MGIGRRKEGAPCPHRVPETLGPTGVPGHFGKYRRGPGDTACGPRSEEAVGAAPAGCLCSGGRRVAGPLPGVV